MIGRTNIKQPVISSQHRQGVPRTLRATAYRKVRDSAIDLQDPGAGEADPAAHRGPVRSSIPGVYQPSIKPSVAGAQG